MNQPNAVERKSALQPGRPLPQLSKSLRVVRYQLQINHRLAANRYSIQVSLFWSSHIPLIDVCSMKCAVVGIYLIPDYILEARCVELSIV
jgi:hypothetical protein